MVVIDLADDRGLVTNCEYRDRAALDALELLAGLRAGCTAGA